MGYIAFKERKLYCPTLYFDFEHTSQLKMSLRNI